LNNDAKLALEHMDSVDCVHDGLHVIEETAAVTLTVEAENVQAEFYY